MEERPVPAGAVLLACVQVCCVCLLTQTLKCAITRVPGGEAISLAGFSAKRDVGPLFKNQTADSLGPGSQALVSLGRWVTASRAGSAECG